MQYGWDGDSSVALVFTLHLYSQRLWETFHCELPSVDFITEGETSFMQVVLYLYTALQALKYFEYSGYHESIKWQH